MYEEKVKVGKEICINLGYAGNSQYTILFPNNQVKLLYSCEFEKVTPTYQEAKKAYYEEKYYEPEKYGRVKPNPIQPKEKKGAFNMSKFNLKNLFKIEELRNGEVALTYDGQLAVKRHSDGAYVNIDKNGCIYDTMGMVIKDAGKVIMLLPTPTLVAGDIIRDGNGHFIKVLHVQANKVRGINLETGRGTTIIKETNMLGISFFQKVTSLMNMQGEGQFNPMLLLALDDEEKDIDPMTLMMLTGAFNQPANGTQFNPMLLLAMKGDIDPLMLMAMGGQQTGFNPFAGLFGQVPTTSVDAETKNNGEADAEEE